MIICRIKGCGEKSNARGLCRKHYARWRKGKDPNVEPDRGRPHNKPLYTLMHDIEVVGEYERENYVYCYIREHKLFDATLVARGRIVMTAMLGRKLETKEYIHHIDDNGKNDSPENLALVTPEEHNRYHKLGFVHTQETKDRISKSLSDVYLYGERMAYPSSERNPNTGRFK